MASRSVGSQEQEGAVVEEPVREGLGADFVITPYGLTLAQYHPKVRYIKLMEHEMEYGERERRSKP